MVVDDKPFQTNHFLLVRLEHLSVPPIEVRLLAFSTDRLERHACHGPTYQLFIHAEKKFENLILFITDEEAKLAIMHVSGKLPQPSLMFVTKSEWTEQKKI